GAMVIVFTWLTLPLSIYIPATPAAADQPAMVQTERIETDAPRWNHWRALLRSVFPFNRVIGLFAPLALSSFQPTTFLLFFAFLTVDISPERTRWMKALPIHPRV